MKTNSSIYMANYIASNRFKTVLLIILLPALLALLLYLALAAFAPQDAGSGYMTSLFYSYILPTMLGSLIWMLIATRFGGGMALSGSKAVAITKSSHPAIYATVEKLSKRAQLPSPSIYLINDQALNAFATGTSPQKASIALTSGIIKHLEEDELEGVIAHELSHIANRDSLLMVLVAVGASLFVMVGQRLLWQGAYRRGKGSDRGMPVGTIIAMVFLLFGYLIAPLIRLAVSRRREYQADACAARLTNKPLALARALSKISGHSRVEILEQQENLNSLCIANPSQKAHSLYMDLSGLGATHPPIEQRIDALKKIHQNKI